MTDRSIFVRLRDWYLKARSQYNELRADLWTFRKCWRGLVVVALAAFILGRCAG